MYAKRKKHDIKTRERKLNFQSKFIYLFYDLRFIIV